MVVQLSTGLETSFTVGVAIDIVDEQRAAKAPALILNTSAQLKIGREADLADQVSRSKWRSLNIKWRAVSGI